MYLFCSDGEVSIEVTSGESKELQSMILNSKLGDKQKYSAIQDQAPEPYDRSLKTLVLECNESKINGSIVDDTLRLEYSEALADVLVSYFNPPKDSHIHLDRIGNEDYVDESCIEISIGEKST